MALNLKPLADRLVVKPTEQEEVTASGIYVPETARLERLLELFLEQKLHLALVVDEYGGVAGLVTMEDVLEQIVGEIEDEYDFDDGTDIFKCGEHEFTAKAATTVEEFNEYFDARLPDDEFDTIAGLVSSALFWSPIKKPGAMALTRMPFGAISSVLAVGK